MIDSKLIVSYDDLFENNDNWKEFEKLHEEFPLLKITFFVITGKCSEEFLQKIRQPWTELVFHSWEHSGHWLHWTKEETKEWLLKYASDKYGFAKGFKAPGWRLTDNIIEACKELDFWICSTPSIPVITKSWYTNNVEGLRHYDAYVEFYDHIQHKYYDGKQWIRDENKFFENLETLKKHCRENNPIFKFISEEVS